MKKLGDSIGAIYMNAPIDVYRYLKELCDKVGVNTELSREFGGEFMLVESADDLGQIGTLVESVLPDNLAELGGWASILETPAVFDMCDFINEEKTYVAILLCTNNAGGTTYFVPADIARTCENIKASMTMTAVAWSGA